jgi:tetratricopeptide (TPR) repeat protein
MRLTAVAILLLLCCTTIAAAQPKPLRTIEDSVVDRYLRHGAWKHSITSPEWGLYIDSALAILPQYAYLWEQRGMPFWKQMKYEIALAYTDSAVKYDTLHWLDYRAFCKCIFQKSYVAAIRDFRLAQKVIGNSTVMDHDYEFYIGLCYLQLAQYDSSLYHFGISIRNDSVTFGPAGLHHLHSFYMGIVQYERQQYLEAIHWFDRALHSNPDFADAEYYKASALYKLGDTTASKVLFQEAEEHFIEGKTINEDNAIYERYPYQLSPAWFDRAKRKTP